MLHRLSFSGGKNEGSIGDACPHRGGSAWTPCWAVNERDGEV